MTLRVLKQVMEEKLDQNNVQVAQVRPLILHHISRLSYSCNLQVTPEKGFEILDNEALQAVIDVM